MIQLADATRMPNPNGPTFDRYDMRHPVKSPIVRLTGRVPRKRGREVVSFVVATALLAMGGNAAGALSPDSRDASVHHVRISPDGKRVLAIVSSPARQGLAVIELQSGELRAVLTPDVRNRVLDDCSWATNDRIVCSAFVFRGYDGSPYPRRRRVRLVAVDADGGHPLPLLDRPPRLAPKLAGVVRGPPTWLDDLEHVLVDPLLHEPDHVLVAAPREARPYTSVYRVPVRGLDALGGTQCMAAGDGPRVEAGGTE